MSKKLLKKIFSTVAAFSLLVNSLSAPLAVYAQEVTPEPTPIVETPTPTPTVTATSVDTITPTDAPTPTSATETEEPQGTVEAISVTAETVAEEPATSYPEPDLSEAQEEGTSAQLVPSISTDKGDYSPTDTVLITGSDFAPNTEYTIEITSDTGNYKFSDRVTSDESGNIFYSYKLDGTYRPNYLVEIKDASGNVVASTTFTDAATLSTTVLSWNTIGVDSNDPVSAGPHQFVIQSRVTNSGADEAQNVNATLALGAGTSYISTVGPLSYALGNIPPGSYKDVFFEVLITPPATPDSPSNDVFGKTKDYSISFTADTGNAPTYNGTLLVESLNSQNRNQITSTVISPTTINIGDTFTVTVNSESSSVFNNISVPMSYDPSIAELLSNVTTYSSPALTENDFYAQNEGNDITSVFTFKAIAAGTSSFFWLIYDQSGSSFHYNSDFGEAIVITIQPELSIEKTPAEQTHYPGEISSFTVTVSNTGDGAGTVSSIVDTLPAGFSYKTGTTTEITTSDPAVNGQELTWTGPWVVAPSASISLSFDAFSSQTPGDYTNSVVAKNQVNSDIGPATALVHIIPNPAVTIEKIVEGGSALPGDWSFTISGVGGTYHSGGQLNLPIGSYTITESENEDYDLFSVGGICSNKNGLAATLEVTENGGTCMFTNTRNSGTITVVKDVVPDDISQWDITISGPTSNSDTLTDGGSTGALSSATGDYTISESAHTGTVGANYINTYSCVDDSQQSVTVGSGTSLNFALDADQNIICTFTNTIKNGSISGHKYHDRDASRDFTQGDQPLDGWEIFLDDGDGVWEQGEPKKTTANGEYSFNDLVPGDYRVCEVLQNGWTPTGPLGNGGCYDVTVGPGQNVTNQDFFNFQNVTLSGYKFKDVDGDGVWDEGELPLDEWTIELTGSASASAVTGFGDWNPGYYEFSNLGPGSYTISEVLPISGDWMQTTLPTTFNFTSLSGGTNVIHLDFGNFEFAKVWGYKYNDLDADADITDAVEALDGWDITLDWGQSSSTVVTGNGVWTDGYYEFIGIGPGSYNLSEGFTLGWTQSFPIGGDYDFTVQSGNVLQFDFANWTIGSIEACKYNENEDLVSGWSFHIGDGQPQQTGQNGCTTFSGLNPGNYTVSENPIPNEWIPVDPVNGERVVVVQSNFTTRVNFFNERKASVTIEKFNDLNGDGIGDDEPRLEGWHFTVYEGTCEDFGTDVLSGTTDSNGELSGLLPAGDYCAVEDDTSHTGWVPTTSTEVDFTVISNGQETILFGNQGQGSITIIKEVIPSDQSQWGFEITGQNQYSDGTTLGDGGSELFDPLAAGEYTVSEIIDSAPYSTEVSCDNETSGETSVIFTLNPGDDVICTFTNTANPGTINGTKWEDVNGDHDRDEGDEGLVEWQIFLYEDNDGEPGDEIDNTFTDEFGDYQFNEVGVGSYFVCEELPGSWMQTYPESGEDTVGIQEEGLGPICWRIQVGPGGEVTDKDFGNFLLGTIGDFVWQDNNGNGNLDFGEPGISGVQANLYLDDGDGIPELGGDDLQVGGTEITDPSGLYEFTDLGPGTYWVDIVDSTVPLGLTLTTDDPYGPITMVSGGSFDAADFGYEPAKGIQIEKFNDKSGGASAGDTVIYTLVITNTGNVAISDVVVTDSLPGGFEYVANSTLIDGAPDIEPVPSGSTLKWSVGWVFPGEPVTITYQAKISTDLPAGTYKNYATCGGQVGGFFDLLDRDLQIGGEEDGIQLEPISCDTDDSDVPVGQTLSYGGKLTPQVLGAATELPATGSSTSLLLFALVVGGFGIFTKIKAYKMGRRKYAKN